MMERQSPLHLRIFLSSPGDVAEERRIATQILKQYQEKPHARGKVTIEVVAWDDINAPTPMAVGETPQESVNRFKGQPADCDLTIVILWGRIGTQLPASMVRLDGSRYESGTVWEYEDAKQARKPGLVYRRTQKPRIDVDDPEFGTKRRQYQAIKDWFAQFKNPDGSLNGGFNEYRSPSAFGTLLDKHIETFVRKRLEAEDTASHAKPARTDSTANSMCSVATESSHVRRINTLPQGGTKFIGREREQMELQERVLTHWLVTVTGAPGIGKSRLAMQVARSLEHEFSDIVFVPLSQLTEPGVVRQRIAHILGIKGQPGKDLVELIGEFLKPRGRLLLILDNCEAVLKGCEEVVKRLHALCGDLHLLLTSRIEFGTTTGMEIENVYRVPPLELPDPEHLPHLKTLANIDSVELLLECLRSRSAPTGLTEDNAKKVAQLCYLLAGLPLAVELVAAQMKTLHLDTVLKQWTKRLDFPGGDVGQTTQEVVILHNAIRGSYNLLREESNGERLQILFRHLSVFKRGWTIEAARRVCGEPYETDEDIQQLMGPLQRASLIEIKDEPDEYRYSYLDPIRDCALVELKSEGRANEVATRHARWATEFAECWQPRLLTNEQAVALLKLIAEADNFREAFQWALQSQDAEIALRVAGALWRLMEIKGFYQDGELRLRMALGVLGAKKFPLLRSKALSGLSILAYRQGDLDTTERCSRESLALERKYGTDRTGVANALNDLGLVAKSRGKYQTALGLYTKSLKIHQAKKDKRGIAVCLFGIGALFKDMGKLDKAEANVEASLKIFEETGNRREAAFALNILGLIRQHRGQYEAAGRYADRSLEIRQNLGDRGGLAQTMVTKASILIGKRDFDAALDLLAQSGNIFFLINDERGVAEALEQLASLASHQDIHAKAVVLYAAAADLRTKLRVPLPPLAQQVRDGRIECVRNALGQTGFDAQWEKGRGTPPRDAFALGVNQVTNPYGNSDG